MTAFSSMRRSKGIQVEIHCRGEELWMTQAQIGQLFGRDQSVVSRHIRNLLAEGELDEASNMQKLHIAGSTRPVAFYSLDMVISVGYRVSSVQATLFRRWATRFSSNSRARLSSSTPGD